MDFCLIEPKINKKKKICHKENKINNTIKEWNTIKHIYRLKNLHSLYNKLYLLTFNHKLECLNYFVDIETDGVQSFTVMSAEIKDTWLLPIKERFEKHMLLLRQIEANDPSLVYCNSQTNTDEGQLTLFN